MIRLFGNNKRTIKLLQKPQCPYYRTTVRQEGTVNENRDKSKTAVQQNDHLYLPGQANFFKNQFHIDNDVVSSSIVTKRITEGRF